MANGENTANHKPLHITGNILLSETDSVPEIWVLGGKIVLEREHFEQQLSESGRAASEVEELSGWAIPGLVDAHCHIGLEEEGEVSPEVATEHALRERRAGVLLVRDAGCPTDTRFLQARSDMPEIIRCGFHIARSKRYLRGFAHEIEPEQLVSEAQVQAHEGDGWIKLVSDWIDRSVGDLAATFPADVTKAAIAAAHTEGVRVTSHCFSEEPLVALAEAGIDCVEHATGLTDETIPMFVEKSIAIVPTLVNIDRFTDYADQGEPKFPVYAKHMRELHARRYETVAAAHDAGIPIYVGTDAGSQIPHGQVAAEIQELRKAGLSNVEALSAGSWAARSWLKRPGIEDGASADIVIYHADPREDLGIVATPQHVVLRGSVF